MEFEYIEGENPYHSIVDLIDQTLSMHLAAVKGPFTLSSSQAACSIVSYDAAPFSGGIHKPLSIRCPNLRASPSIGIGIVLD